ncbi:hypothetical protein K431DRAFT_312687 [Polychaeton citri CBS 116435]|uniref:NACHT domain-containing protein n=1 Tax=Polychaeton citri CBS 116435 TaxID=1314669 RepID=A0A9P4Q806_9PEZI|nr:hypothetical protein K431DRAFT_312687 [Polychaeton citri CBS 116435]
MSSSSTQNGRSRHRLYERFNRMRLRSRHSSEGSRPRSRSRAQSDQDLVTDTTASCTQSVTPTANPASDVLATSTNSGDDEVQSRSQQIAISASGLHRTSVDAFISYDGAGDVTTPNLWSAAFREAVDSLGSDIDVAILKSKHVEQLFRDLEEMDKEASNESAFLRGVRHLHSIQIPLERFKLALDLASPLTSCEPTVTTVFGVLRGVTAIAISFASADLEFAKQIGEMLEQISYIDDCDTLGQRTNKNDIHKALVSVYKKILEFYKVSFEILTRKGAKLVVKVILEQDHLPSIIQDFLRQADVLRKLVQKATWEIVEDIKGMLYDREISRWLGVEKMSRQSRHHADLRELRADQACDFLLANPTFIEWYRAPESRQLVLLGEMGCGKTIATAFLVDELDRRNKTQLPQPKICYYYCRDGETGNAVQILSALILALLGQLPGLKKIFYQWYKQVQASGNFDPATDIRRLEEFLQEVLKSLDRPVFIVIDGLDECDRDSQYSVIKLMKTVSQSNPRLKTLLSTRPEEEILEQLDGIAKIDVVSDPRRDRIIVERIIAKQLPHLPNDVKTIIADKLSCLARGSAIWTRMIVELIEVRKIRALGPMRLFLEGLPLPSQLSQLYETLISRCTSNDPENLQITGVALKLLAVARRPLSILELAWAAALAIAGPDVTTIAALAELIDPQRVVGLVHPFIARIDFGDVKKVQVRLVHQSVKEFIIKDCKSNLPPLHNARSGIALNQAFIDQANEHLEACALDLCIRYLLLDDIGQINIFSEEQMAIDELPKEIDIFDDNTGPVEYDPYCTWEVWEESMIHYDPTERGFGGFFVYASCHWPDHFGAVKTGSLPSLHDIEHLCQAGSTRLHNWIQQNRRPGCAIEPRFLFDSILYDPLSITALYGSEAMLQYMSENSTLSKETFLPHSVTRAAEQILQWGDLSKLKIMMLDDRLGCQLRNLDFFRLVVRQWCHPSTSHNNWDVVFDLVDHVLDIMVQDHWANELLCVAARAGCLPLVRRLMTRAHHGGSLRTQLLGGIQREQGPQPSRESTHQSIGEAVLGNHVDIVEYLLGEDGVEAHLRYLNLRGENVLHLASEACNPVMFHLLVPRLPEGRHQTDERGRTALVRVIMSSSDPKKRYESARTLLSHTDADVTPQNWSEQQDPLRTAVRLGDLEMCRILISIGNVNPLTALKRGENGQMELMDKKLENDEHMPDLLRLLSEHANIASKLVE